MKTRIYLILFFLTFSNLIYSQPPYRGKMMQRRKEMIEKEKIPFLTNYLDLSVKEAEKFWPIYNEYSDKQKTILNKKRELLKKIKFGDNNEKDAAKINSQYMEILQQECDLTKEYNEKFKKVLPVYKVNKIYLAEREFKKHLIQKMRSCRN